MKWITVFSVLIFTVFTYAKEDNLALSRVMNHSIQGLIQSTGYKTDLAVAGDGFFALQGKNGKIYYTRYGKFFLNKSSQIIHHPSKLPLMTIASGKLKVLSLKGHGFRRSDENPIVGISIDEDGKIIGLYRKGESIEITEISLAVFQNSRGLKVVNLRRHLLSETTDSGRAYHLLPGLSRLTGKIYSRSLEEINRDYYASNFDQSRN